MQDSLDDQAVRFFKGVTLSTMVAKPSGFPLEACDDDGLRRIAALDAAGSSFYYPGNFAVKVGLILI